MDDDVAKGLFGDRKNKRNIVGFLKTILGLPDDEYKKMSLGNPALRRRWKKDKRGPEVRCVVDVLVETKSGIVVDVEFQVEGQKDIIQRILYYLAKLIADQLGIGNKYGRLHPVISVLVTSNPIKPGGNWIHEQLWGV